MSATGTPLAIAAPPIMAPSAPMGHSSLAMGHSSRAAAPPPGWRYLGVAHGEYALFETPAGLLLLDRRAAHERVWYERLQAQFRGGPVTGQRLLLPVPLELDPVATALLLDRRDFLRTHGFEVAEFGRNFFRIEAVPDWLEPADAEPFARDLLGALRDGRLAGADAAAAGEQLARLAAARAIRLPAAGEAEMRTLVAQLFACRAPFTSPAGRPTCIELSHAELSRRFSR